MEERCKRCKISLVRNTKAQATMMWVGPRKIRGQMKGGPLKDTREVEGKKD